MLARVRLSAALALAAAVCACARPDGPPPKRSYSHNIVPTKGGSKAPTVNVVQVLPDPQSNPVVHYSDSDLDALVAPKNTEANSLPVVAKPVKPAKPEQAVVPTAEQAAVPVPSVFLDEVRPVNKRYPHAVLFGGTCGGTIIHPKWVLTAGHCTLFTGGRYVLAGTNNSDDGSGVTRKVKKLHVHPLFSVGPYWLNAKEFGIKQVAARWDFMLAELESPLELDGQTVAAAPLDEGPAPAPGTFVGYAGYGTDRHGGYMRSEMHAMHLKTLDDGACSTLEQFSGKDMICAKGYTPRFDSACNGDSGSGLVQGDGKLVGVASWVQNDAFECARGNIVVFSRVASARDWIRKITGL